VKLLLEALSLDPDNVVLKETEVVAERKLQVRRIRRALSCRSYGCRMAQPDNRLAELPCRLQATRLRERAIEQMRDGEFAGAVELWLQFFAVDGEVAGVVDGLTSLGVGGAGDLALQAEVRRAWTSDDQHTLAPSGSSHQI
jgi:hypothetical protein